MSTISVISRDKSGWDNRLDRLTDPPKWLQVAGDLRPDRPSIAVVGSRKCSTYGRSVCQNLTRQLASAGVSIISGLALGIDSHAHRAALDVNGYTVAVLPSGLKNIYPASHKMLARQILEQGGAVVSEYEPHTQARPYHFVARNRLVAALADAVLVVEAARKSGTLITAEYALDMGLAVLAVPGPIDSAGSAGTNRLIQTGAQLVSSVDDILQAMGWVPSKATKPRADNPEQQRILNKLQKSPASANELVQTTGIDPASLARHLTHLEICGHIQAAGNNTWVIVSRLAY